MISSTTHGTASEQDPHPSTARQSDELYKSELDHHLWTLANRLRSRDRRGDRHDRESERRMPNRESEDDPSAAEQVHRIWSWLRDLLGESAN
jgi:hypothetical protein